MKKIEAIIEPHRLSELRHALEQAGCTDLVVTDVRGTDLHGGHTEIYRGVAYRVDFAERLKLEVVVDDWAADEIATILYEAAPSLEERARRVLIQPVDVVAIST
jgi:nitrogen regulatory protein P-II 1